MHGNKIIKLLFAVFLVLLGWQLFSAGSHLATLEYAALAANIAIGFMAGIAAKITFDEVLHAERHAAAEEMAELAKEQIEKFTKSVVGTLKDLKNEIDNGGCPTEDEDKVDKGLVAAVIESVKEITGSEDAPKADQLEAVKKRFTEKTGHALELTLDDDGLEVKISRHPIKAEPTTTTTTTRASGGATDIVKSKSQQRREAALKADKDKSKTKG